MFTQQKPRLCCSTEGTWSLLLRAEAQNHLYVSTVISFLVPVSAHRNREEFFRTNMKKHYPSLATALKLLGGNNAQKTCKVKCELCADVSSNLS